MKLVDETIIPKDKVKDSDDSIHVNLEKRCLELIEMHPGKKNLFQSYILKQEEEKYVLENKIICSTMVIKQSL